MVYFRPILENNAMIICHKRIPGKLTTIIPSDDEKALELYKIFIDKLYVFGILVILFNREMQRGNK